MLVVMVAGVPTGTPKPAVLTSTAVDAQRRPLVDSDWAAASRPTAAASAADRASDAARAAELAASLTVVRANQIRPPMISRPRVISRAGMSSVISTVAEPRWSVRWCWSSR